MGNEQTEAGPMTTAPMKDRPMTEAATKGERTRARIVETGARLIWHAGYEGVSMNDIARAAAVNKATMYQYFASKEDLAVEIVAHQEAITLSEAFDGSRPDAAAADRLDGIYERVHALHKAIVAEGGRVPGCPFVNLAVEMAPRSEPIRAAVEATFRRFRTRYLEIARAWRREQGIGRRGDEGAIADALVANMNGTMVMAKVRNDPAEILAGRDRARRLLTG